MAVTVMGKPRMSIELMLSGLSHYIISAYNKLFSAK
ncbi:MAG: hypothetical protein Sv326_1005 [Candidatus Fermentimicrarchaeum limneticum]|uniref:Uncharacterized protein n=1 Tax=Fermentimicrarchaeum limneticum TaxID=2795018 RepID=A0A7D6BG42_FERL1|nr:MAG: hypothetical protein Sv326_1005 [Candidatus Fermentimicrarchaeum limneticum]